MAITKTKSNPRRTPMTLADVNRAEQRGREIGLEFALNIVLYVLKDKHDAPTEDILQLRDEFMYVIDSIAKRYLSYPDIVNALKSDYDLTVRIVDREGIK